MKNILFILLFISCLSVHATKYYVSNDGNDSANGLTTETAWATLAKVTASTFAAGDSILFNKGDIWREAVTIPSAGTSTNYIYFGNYGTGANPKFYGSTQAVTWTNVSANIWVSATTVTDPYATTGRESEIYFIDELGNTTTSFIKKTYQAGFANITAEYQWTWYNNQVYIYAATDPDARYAAVEVPQIQDGISMNNKNYLSFDGIEVCFYKDKGFKETSWTSTLIGFKANNLKVHHIGTKDKGAHGIMVNRSKILIQNCEIYEIGRRGISIYTYPEYNDITLDTIIIQNNIFHDGYHTTGIDIATNSGTYQNFIKNVFIRNNLFYEDSTRTISVENTVSYFIGTADNDTDVTDSLSNIYIYNNQFRYTKQSCIGTSGAKDVYVYNNSMYGANPYITADGGLVYFMGKTGSTLAKRWHIVNNIAYANTDNTVNIGGQLVYYNATEAGCIVEMDYNIWYQLDSDVPLFQLGATTYTVSQWSTYKTNTGFDAHSYIVNPKYSNTTVNLNIDSDSQAVNSGTNTGITTDYSYNARSIPIDIGAYEYQQPTTTTKKGLSTGYKSLSGGKKRLTF